MNKSKAKVLVLGDVAAGKSTLVQSYARKNYQFTSDYVVTQGAEVHSKIVPLGEDHVELYLFDLSGHEFYESVAAAASKGADLAMVTYDCTSQESLKNSLKLFDKFKKTSGKANLPGVLVATKCEDNNAREISSIDGENYAKKLGLDFFQVSAAFNTNVDKPFLSLAKKAKALPSTAYN